jgi:uncharacterized membrane protein
VHGDGFTGARSVDALDLTKNNVEAIASLEREALRARSPGERISDAITHTVGTATFVALHLLWFAVWVAVNLGLVLGVAPFDPFPFGILTLLVSGEGVLLALFILISQNRMTRQADRRAHLALQVSMLAEQELTLLLQLQQRLCERAGVSPAADAVTDRLLQKTDVKDVVHELEARLPSE